MQSLPEIFGNWRAAFFYGIIIVVCCAPIASQLFAAADMRLATKVISPRMPRLGLHE
jgi:hypothetical protein